MTDSKGKSKKTEAAKHKRYQEIFVQSVNYLVDMLNLNDWEIIFEDPINEEKAERYRACIHPNQLAKICIFTCYPEEFFSDQEVVESAYHEVIELLLCDFEDFLLDDDISHNAKNVNKSIQRHAIIHRLSNIYLPHHVEELMKLKVIKK